MYVITVTLLCTALHVEKLLAPHLPKMPLCIHSRFMLMCVNIFSMFHRAFFNSIIDKHQHMHFFTFKTVLV